MSKAENFAIKKYPVSIEDIHGHKIDVNLWQRKACVDGYHQAEKDLELSWEDIKLIGEIIDDVIVENLHNEKWFAEDLYTEVLKQFKEIKK